MRVCHPRPPARKWSITSRDAGVGEKRSSVRADDGRTARQHRPAASRWPRSARPTWRGVRFRVHPQGVTARLVTNRPSPQEPRPLRHHPTRLRVHRLVSERLGVAHHVGAHHQRLRLRRPGSAHRRNSEDLYHQRQHAGPHAQMLHCMYLLPACLRELARRHRQTPPVPATRATSAVCIALDAAAESTLARPETSI